MNRCTSQMAQPATDPNMPAIPCGGAVDVDRLRLGRLFGAPPPIPVPPSEPPLWKELMVE